MVLDVTARKLNEKDAEKQTLFTAQKVWWEIGKDLKHRMRYGAWQIKEIVDLTLQPMETAKEQYLIHFDTDVEEVEIETKLSYFINGKKGDVIYTTRKEITYDDLE